MVTPKFGVDPILSVQLLYGFLLSSERVDRNQGLWSRREGFPYIKGTDKMDATPSFGVTEVPFNPQLTLLNLLSHCCAEYAI